MRISLHVRIGAVVLLMLAAGYVVGAQEPALEQRSLLGGKVSMLIPKEFTQASTEMVVKKYPNANRPDLVYTNANFSVTVGLGHTVHRVLPSELPLVLDAMRTAFRNQYRSATWFRSEMRKINGRPFFLMEVRTPTIDVEVRNIMVATSLDDRLLMITFNASKSTEQQWMAAGNRMIESITVK